MIEAALAKAPSPGIERSLIATTNGILIERFDLALNHDSDLARAFEIVEDGRSRVIAGHLRSARTEVQLRSLRIDALNTEISRIQLKLVSSAHTAPERSKLLRALNKAEAEAEVEAVQFSHRRPSHSVRQQPVSLSTIQSSLAPDELLVEYVVSDKEGFALSVTRDSTRSYKIVDSKEFQSLVHAYSEEVGSAVALAEQSRTAAHRLYEAVMGPIKEVGRKQRLIVVPDGPLDSVGFDSLIDDSGRYLLRSHVISYVPSATVLHLLRNRLRNLNALYSLLAFGAPRPPDQLPPASSTKVAVSRQLLDISGGNLTQLRSASGEVRVISTELG